MTAVSTTFEPGKIVDFRFHDLDHMAEKCPQKWSQAYRKTTQGKEYGYYRQIHTANIQLTQIGWIAGLNIQTDCPPQAVGFCSQTKGMKLTGFCGRELKATESMFVRFGHDYDLVAHPGTEYIVIAVNHELLKHHAAAIWGEIPNEFPSKARIVSKSMAHQRFVQEKLISAITLLMEHPGNLNDPTKASKIEEDLIETLLLSAEPGARELPSRVRHHAAQKARDFILEHIDKPFGVRSMCEAIGISERALRKGFIEYFGLAPKACIQALRLHNIRRALKVAHSQTTTVTQIAMEWGITHLGRFSQDYKRLFGESPSTTLQIEPSHTKSFQKCD